MTSRNTYRMDLAGKSMTFHRPPGTDFCKDYFYSGATPHWGHANKEKGHSGANAGGGGGCLGHIVDSKKRGTSIESMRVAENFTGQRLNECKTQGCHVLMGMAGWHYYSGKCSRCRKFGEVG